MQAGKLSNEMLNDKILSGINKNNEDVIIGPKVGEDCSIVKFGDDYCVLTTDPVTAAQNGAGKIGVHICCNDIASAGVSPLGVMVTLLAPVGTEIDEIKKVMDDVNEACSELSIDVLGGHTEITDAVNRIVLSVMAIGKGASFVSTGGAQEGDDIVVTGYAGLEGTAIIASDYFEYLKDRMDNSILRDAADMLKSISVVKVGILASGFGVNSMHDATEGGILGAIWEVAEASVKGAQINQDKIPIRYETIAICREVGINPYRLISSGCMIITCRDGAGLCRLLGKNGINAQTVGKITKGDKIIYGTNGESIIAPPESDEIYRVKDLVLGR